MLFVMKSGLLLLRESRSAIPISDYYVPEIFMQQFWYTIKKASDTDSYEFLLANKKCTVNVDVFRTILDICPRIVGVEFADVPDDDTALTFLIDLGYKVLRDGEFEFWPTYDPSSKVCNGGDKIHGLDKLGNIKQWECNRDDERRNEKGKEMLFPDLLQIRYKNSKVDDTLRARRSIGVHYTHGTMPDLRKKSDGKVDALPLGRVNMSSFKGMIRNEMDPGGSVQREE
ncbi:hypothetical protein Tco_0929516 [Tanacetum coccineum]